MKESRKPEEFINSDKPINQSADDQFGRAGFSQAIANQMLATPSVDGYVLGIQGPWGSGKTSVLNIIAECLEKSSERLMIVRFNPWLFSGAEDLLQQFFKELISQFASSHFETLKEAGKALKKYTQKILPITELPLFGGAEIPLTALRIVGGFMSGGSDDVSVYEQRKTVEDLLKKHGKKIVVMIDDIDRLRTDEILSVMKLVKLTADFPNMIYVLAFDRAKVEEALDDKSTKGRDYIEKIVQIPHDLPLIRGEDLTKFLVHRLELLTQTISHGPFYEEDWVNIFGLRVKDLFNTPRDVRRYINSVTGTLSVVGEELAVVDVLAMEAIRLFLPDVYEFIYRNTDLFTSVGESLRSQRQDSAQKDQFNKFVKSLPDSEGVQDLLGRLFPACQKFYSNMHFGHSSSQDWRRKRKISHVENLKFYLEKSRADGSLSAIAITKLYYAMGDAKRFEELLSEYEPLTLETAIARLEDYEDEFDPKVAETAIPVLCNQALRLREEKSGMWDFGPNLVVGRVNLRILRKIPSREEILSVTQKVLPKINTLTWKLDLIHMIGHQQGVGHKLIEETAAIELENELLNRVLDTSYEKLGEERELPLILYLLKKRSDEDRGKVLNLCSQKPVFLRLLRQSLAENMSQSMGSAHVRKERVLRWHALKNLLGEDQLIRTLLSFESELQSQQLDDRTKSALDLALKYAKGEAEPPKER